MKQASGIVVALLIGFCFGTITPLAGAHPDDECHCTCPPCPENGLMMNPDPLIMEGPAYIVNPVPNIGIPLLPEPAEEAPVDHEAIQKALDAIQRAEEGEAEMDAAESQRMD